MAPRRRNPKGAGVLLGSAIVLRPGVARPRLRAIAALLLRDGPQWDHLRRAGLSPDHSRQLHGPVRALRSHRNIRRRAALLAVQHPASRTTVARASPA